LGQLSPELPPPPAILDKSVGVWLQSGWRGGGRLVIQSGQLTLTPDKIIRMLSGGGPIIQTDRKAVVVRTRIAPPWMNCNLVVRGEAGGALAVMTFLDYTNLRAALERAGFEVAVRRTWFSFGLRLAGIRLAGIRRGTPSTPPGAAHQRNADVLSTPLLGGLLALAVVLGAMGIVLALAFASDETAQGSPAIALLVGATVGVTMGVPEGRWAGTKLASGQGLQIPRWYFGVVAVIGLVYLGGHLLDVAWFDSGWGALTGAFFASGLVTFVVVYRRGRRALSEG